MPANALTWALVVPTYMREDVLPRCLRLGARPNPAAARDHRRRLEPRMEERARAYLA